MKFFLKLTLIAGVVLSVGCSSIKKSLKETANKNQYHIGFYLIDPETGKELINVNGDKYFTPASNTKILTLYAALTTLGDSIPAFEYQVQDSVIQIWPSGDPSLLYYSLPENKTISYLSSFDTVKISNAYFYEDRFGPGWSWEDYAYSYSPERSVFPIYGNVVEFNKDSLTNQLAVMPNLFADSVEVEEYGDFNVKREEQNNVFHIDLGDCSDCERVRPFRVSEGTTIKLLEDTIKTNAYFNQMAKGLDLTTYYSQLSDSVYKHMMQESDNFIAEQLLLLVAGQLTDTLSSEIAIDTISQRMNAFLPDPMNWVDGSGLSRYNLFTPRSVVALWQELIRLYGQERLMQIVSIGGVAGTIENYYLAEPPYIYGKTGTLSNNHNLSGMLLTKSGKTLLFSFMNNNYPGSSSGIKKEMEQILMEVHEKY